jgi:hypothetical protein
MIMEHIPMKKYPDFFALSQLGLGRQLATPFEIEEPQFAYFRR